MFAQAAGVGRGTTGGNGRPNASTEDPNKPPAAYTWDDIRRFMRILWPYFWPRGNWHRFLAVSCFAALGLSKVCNLIAPAYLGIAMDDLGSGNFPLSPLIVYGILRFAVSGLEEIQRLVYLRVKQVAFHETAVDVFQHVHSLSLHWHINKRSGVVLRAMDRGVSSASTVVDMLFLRLVPVVVEMFAMAVIFGTKYRSVGAALSLFVTFSLYFATTVYLARRRKRLRQTMHRADNEANQIAVDSLTAFETVKAFNNESFEVMRYSDAVKTFQQASKEQQASNITLNISQSLIIRLCTVSVLLFAAQDVLAGKLSTGGFVALLSYVQQLFMPLSWLGTMYTMVTSAFTDMRNLSDLLHEKADIVDSSSAKQLLLKNVGRGGQIEFRNVVFAYPDAKLDNIEAQMAAQKLADDLRAAHPSWYVRLWRWLAGARSYGTLAPSTAPAPQSTPMGAGVDVEAGAAPKPPILKGISFVVRPGTTTAIVGPTGSGKSTIAKLLFRFYDVSSGEITIDGNDIRDIKQTSLRDSLGLVPQDCVLFNNTIGFNIKYGRPSATDEDVQKVAAGAQIEAFINTQPKGYDTMVGERGLRLSGGEKQRIAIARTLLKDPPILILDEATASLDTITEANIQAALNNVRSGRTVICIAHRLSTIKDADEIIVLAQGTIEERGTHDQLLAKRGRYFNLWTQQATAAAGDFSALPEPSGADSTEAVAP